MFEERTGKPINQIVIAIAVENEGTQLFVETKENYLTNLQKYIDNYHNT